jgi:hypothetical protein
MNRITDKNLEGVCAIINRVTGSPEKPYVDGVAQIGNYHIGSAYGGVSLQRMSNSSGGVTEPLYCGYQTKRDLWNRMHAFLKGIEMEQERITAVIENQDSRSFEQMMKTVDGSQPKDSAALKMAIVNMIGGAL